MTDTLVLETLRHHVLLMIALDTPLREIYDCIDAANVTFAELREYEMRRHATGEDRT